MLSPQFLTSGFALCGKLIDLLLGQNGIQKKPGFPPYVVIKLVKLSKLMKKIRIVDVTQTTGSPLRLRIFWPIFSRHQRKELIDSVRTG
jgi:hypothetical protein